MRRKISRLVMVLDVAAVVFAVHVLAHGTAHPAGFIRVIIFGVLSFAFSAYYLHMTRRRAS